jgi:hypothetical protein
MIRDSHSKALVETDVTELQKYRREKMREKELREIKSDIESLKVCINKLYETVKKIEARA